MPFAINLSLYDLSDLHNFESVAKLSSKNLGLVKHFQATLNGLWQKRQTKSNFQIWITVETCFLRSYNASTSTSVSSFTTYINGHCIIIILIILKDIINLSITINSILCAIGCRFLIFSLPSRVTLYSRSIIFKSFARKTCLGT